MNERYTSEADIALQRAADSLFAQKLLEPNFVQIMLGCSPDGRHLQIVERPGDGPTLRR